MTRSIPAHVFRAYDIRGIAYQEINASFAYRLATCFHHQLHSESAIIVAHDCRLSSPELQAAATQGFIDQGRDVYALGMTTSPMAYFACQHYQAAGCLMVTASHNPANHNGFKLLKGQHALVDEEIQALYQAMQQPIHKPQQTGKVHRRSIQQLYSDYIYHDIQKPLSLRLVIDAANGPAGCTAAPLYRRLGCTVIELYCQPDGHFPNHHPDPSVPQHLKDLAQAVIRHDADLGIAFDGDGDRIGLVDRHGISIAADILLLWLAQELLQRKPKACIIGDVKSAQALANGVRKAGGQWQMCRTGHSPIKQAMQQYKAELAGDISGHLYFKDRYFGFDDAIYAGARLMELITQHPQQLDGLLANTEQGYISPEIRLACSKAQEITEAAKVYFQDDFHCQSLDGLRMYNHRGWALLRSSNTENALSIRFEGCDQQELQAWHQRLQQCLKPYQLQLPELKT